MSDQSRTPANPLPSASSDDLSTRLAHLSAQATDGPWHHEGDKLMAGEGDLAFPIGGMMDECDTWFIYTLVNAYRSGALVPAPSPARVIGVTEAAKLRSLVWNYMPTYGEMSFRQLEEAVAEATMGNRQSVMERRDGVYIGHETAGINYNSLNRIVSAFVRAALEAAYQTRTSPEAGGGGTFDEGIDFALERLCAFLGVDKHSVCWDAATETVEGDVSSVIGNILRAHFGEEWGPEAALASPPAVEWRAMDVRPERGRKVIVPYEDGSGAVMCWLHDDGAIDHEGDDCKWPPADGYRWAYLPDGYEFWCENCEEPLTLALPPAPAVEGK